MKLEQRTLRICTVILLCAVVMRLLSGGLLDTLAQALSSPRVTSILLYLETGRVIRPLPQQSEVPDQPAPTQTIPVATQPQPLPPDLVQAVFSPEEAGSIAISNFSGYDADLEALLQQPLSWDLTADGPAVLIVHAHGSESYVNNENYTASADYRTLDERYNMISIGDYLASLLEAGGIAVLHDRTLHDYPSFNSSYDNSRASVQEYLTQYPSIRMVLDLHRDAAEDGKGNQLDRSVVINGEKVAQLMMVVGTDAGGLNHPNWQDNMALAAKLHVLLNRSTPGLCRPISFRSQRFNQDLSAGAMLIEVGAAGNTRQEALLAAELLAQGIIDLAHGSAPYAITADSTS